jgi:spoIIIJ-associated protein
MDDQDVNPNEVVSEGKNVDDAIERALERLGVSRDQVDVEVLEEGTQGMFGLIGAKQAKVVVRKKGANGEVSAKIEEMVTNLLRLMGISGQVAIRLEDDIHRVDIETAGVDGLLIGKKGESLEDIGHLLRRMVGKQLKKSVRMDIDVGGYKKRRSNALKSKALSLAARVKSTGKEMQMEPLSAAERRVVHLALAEDPQIRTHTVGDGDLKTVVISSARRGAHGGGSGGHGGRMAPASETDRELEDAGDELEGGGAEGEAWSTGE